MQMQVAGALERWSAGAGNWNAGAGAGDWGTPTATVPVKANGDEDDGKADSIEDNGVTGEV